MLESQGWLKLVYDNFTKFKKSLAFKPQPHFIEMGSREPMMYSHVKPTKDANIGGGAFLPAANDAKLEVVRMTMSSKPSERTYVNYFHRDGRFLMLNAHRPDGERALQLAERTMELPARLDVVVSLYPQAGEGVGAGDYVFQNFAIHDLRRSAVTTHDGTLHAFVLGR